MYTGGHRMRQRLALPLDSTRLKCTDKIATELLRKLNAIKQSLKNLNGLHLGAKKREESAVMSSREDSCSKRERGDTSESCHRGCV